MTIGEMHIGVNLEVQKIASNINDDFLSQEIDYYLNESISDYIEGQYNSIKNEEVSIEGQYVNDNLRTILLTSTISSLNFVGHIPNALSGELPSDYRYYIFSRTFDNSKWRNNRKLGPMGIKKYIQTTSNLPMFRELPVFIEGTKITVIGDYKKVLPNTTEIKLTYIKNPTKVNFSTNTDSNLPEHTHKEIVKMTSQKILQSISMGVSEE